MPDTCVWTHFGDLDAAGLAIFEDLLRKSGVQGHFCPDPDGLNSVRGHLPQWPGHQAVQPDRYATSQVRALARRAAALGTAVEQEGLLAACARAGVDVAAIGLQGAYWSP